MASTLTPTSFNITITEEQIVRNSTIKHEVRKTINDVTNVDHRILTCPVSTSIDLFNVNGINPGAGTFPSSSLKYARISNFIKKGEFKFKEEGIKDTLMDMAIYSLITMILFEEEEEQETKH